jgi:dolichol-phosphate mannosyltransferase
MQSIVIIPTYNEAENLPVLVSALFTLSLDDLRILVVDDNSPDGTGQVADRLAEEHTGKLDVLHRPGKQGLAAAYINAFQYVLSEKEKYRSIQAIGQMDADLSHPPELVPALLEALGKYDLATGSRYIAGGGVEKSWPAWRKGLSHFGNFYARTILGLPIHDVTGGFRFWHRKTLAALPLERIRSTGYGFLVEMIYLAYRMGYSIQEIPFCFADRTQGASKMSFRIQREAALQVWLMRYRYSDLQVLDRRGADHQ